MNAERIRRFRARAQVMEESVNPCRVQVDSGDWIPASTISRQAAELDLALGGARQKAPQVFRIRKEFLPTPPIAEKTKITRDGGGVYRVQTINGDQPSSPAWLLTCELWNR